MARLIILVAVVVLLLLFLNWFRNTPPQRVAAVLRKSFLWGAIALLLLATLTGRLNPIFAAAAAAIPVAIRVLSLLRMLPAIQQTLRSLGLGGLNIPGAGAGSGGSGGTSSIRTRYLDVTLDHDSGNMDGTVREGPFEGRRLSDLEIDQLLRMLELYEDSDAQSASVLSAFLDRQHGDDWRETAAGGGAGDAGSSRGSPSPAQGMTKNDAWSILGLAPGAAPDEIRAAHRRLMQKLHPDRGGSDYLAAQINAAKTVLLGE
ncbi:MAG: DnaJ domain-containing protein [Thiohalocapsa sp.]|nr:DnaJ domain-containing protein [Thiohalocapsa sp.]